jgi:hypothetical protein
MGLIISGIFTPITNQDDHKALFSNGNLSPLIFPWAISQPFHQSPANSLLAAYGLQERSQACAKANKIRYICDG